MRRLAANLTLMLFVFALSLAAMEGILRWQFHIPPDFLEKIIRFDASLSPAKRLKPDLDMRLTGAYGEFRFRLRTDAEGFRLSALLHDAREPEIVFVGDSQTVGVGVEDSETFPSIVGQLLKKPVLNTACYGYNNLEEHALIKDLLASKRPKAVALCFFAGNDPYENFKQRGEPGEEETVLEHRASWFDALKQRLVKRSALYYAASNLRNHPWMNRLFRKARLVRETPPFELRVFKKQSLQASYYWRVTEEALLQSAEEAKRAGVRFFIVFIPDRYQVDDKYWNAWVMKYRLEPELYDLDAPNDRLREFCGRHGIELIDTTAVLRGAHAAGKKVYWSIDNHLAREGDQVIGQFVASYLQTEK